MGGSGIGLEVVGSLSEGILLVLCEAAVMRVRLREREGTLAVDASESGGAATRCVVRQLRLLHGIAAVLAGEPNHPFVGITLTYQLSG